jgi:penicillin amidase
LTHHGPIITETYGLETFAEEAGIDLPESYALALRWTALEPSCVFCAIWQFNTAENWDDFRAAAQEFAVPAQNLLYADVDGNIGYQTPGNVPLRAEGHDGTLPVPGWMGEYEWSGYIPFEELPNTFNPPSGYIATANNAIVGPDYPYSISQVWRYGFRAQRVVELIEAMTVEFEMVYMQGMQGENKDLLAQVLVSILLEVPLDDEDLEAARRYLSDWDYQLKMDSAPGALYMVFWRNLLDFTFDELPDSYELGVGSRAMEVVRRLVAEPDNPWWDDQTTPEVETRDEIFQLAFEAAYKEIRDLQGKDPAGWAWGELHTITFQNQVMTSFPLINTVFDRGPYPTAGGNAIINATGWSIGAPYIVDWLPSMRMIVDLSDLGNSLVVNTTGQSGHPYHPHYDDQPDLWRNIQYRPMHWEQATIAADAEGHLKLVP